MKIAIYQIDLDRDENGVAFEGFDSLQKITGSQHIDSEIYVKVFEGNVEANGLEDVYRIFNIDFPDAYNGRSLSVSDIVEVIESDNIKSGQKTVEGCIQCFYPFEEEVCIVCNDEGKLTGLPLNRAIYNEYGEMLDVMAGTFFICDCSGESFGSLSDEMIDKYLEMFRLPETFVRVNGKIQALKYEPKD